MNVFKFILLASILGLTACSQQRKEPTNGKSQTLTPKLTINQAAKLSELPLNCIQNEYPNKLGQVLNSKQDLAEPHKLHPAFYGCFDWHSTVHGHWSLVKLLREFTHLASADTIKKKLKENITANHIKKEVDYFDSEHNQSYERTYGWAWLLKLAEELHTWDDPFANKLSHNLQPLTDKIVQNYLEFLPKLRYPIRVGEHTNTAFGLIFAWDYAKATNKTDLKNLISARSRDFFIDDTNCPIDWEPSGYDFLSPCLEEVDLMRRVLPHDSFDEWVDGFLPSLKKKSFHIKVAEVSDRSDPYLVHLDGLNFSRAWIFYGLANQYPQEFGHLKKLGDKHVNYSLPNLVGDSYEGGHWLGTYAVYALAQRNKE